MTPNTPESPPAGPVIPVGLSTKIGLITSLVLGIVAAVTAFLNGDHSEATLTTLIGGIVTLIAVLTGRYAQATAAVRAAPDLLPEDDYDDIVDDFEEETLPVPEEDDLREEFPEDAPPDDGEPEGALRKPGITESS